MIGDDAIRAEAERRAPYPKVEPSVAGFVGFSIAGTAVGFFCAIAGVDLEGGNPRAGVALIVMLAVGYAAPFIYFNNQKRRHFNLLVTLESIARESDAKGS